MYPMAARCCAAPRAERCRPYRRGSPKTLVVCRSYFFFPLPPAGWCAPQMQQAGSLRLLYVTAWLAVLALAAPARHLSVASPLDVLAGEASSALPVGSVTAASLRDGAVHSNHLAEGAVTPSALARGAVTSSSISAGAVTADGLATDAVGSDAIADGAVDASALAPASVGRVALGAGAVGTAQLAPASVGDEQLAPGAVGLSRLSVPLQLTVEAVLVLSLVLSTAALILAATSLARVSGGLLSSHAYKLGGGWHQLRDESDVSPHAAISAAAAAAATSAALSSARSERLDLSRVVSRGMETPSYHGSPRFRESVGVPSGRCSVGTSTPPAISATYRMEPEPARPGRQAGMGTEWGGDQHRHEHAEQGPHGWTHQCWPSSQQLLAVAEAQGFQLCAKPELSPVAHAPAASVAAPISGQPGASPTVAAGRGTLNGASPPVASPASTAVAHAPLAHTTPVQLEASVYGIHTAGGSRRTDPTLTAPPSLSDLHTPHLTSPPRHCPLPAATVDSPAGSVRPTGADEPIALLEQSGDEGERPPAVLDATPLRAVPAPPLKAPAVSAAAQQSLTPPAVSAAPERSFCPPAVSVHENSLSHPTVSEAPEHSLRTPAVSAAPENGLTPPAVLAAPEHSLRPLAVSPALEQSRSPWAAPGQPQSPPIASSDVAWSQQPVAIPAAQPPCHSPPASGESPSAVSPARQVAPAYDGKPNDGGSAARDDSLDIHGSVSASPPPPGVTEQVPTASRSAPPNADALARARASRIGNRPRPASVGAPYSLPVTWGCGELIAPKAVREDSLGTMAAARLSAVAALASAAQVSFAARAPAAPTVTTPVSPASLGVRSYAASIAISPSALSAVKFLSHVSSLRSQVSQ